jgi:hypothetical protein
MLALTYLFCLPACRLDQCHVDPTPDFVARLRCVRPSCRMQSRLPRPVDRFISRSDLRPPPVDEPMAAHPDLRPCRMRTLQSRIPRPTCLPASIPSASPSLASVCAALLIDSCFAGFGRFYEFSAPATNQIQQGYVYVLRGGENPVLQI